MIDNQALMEFFTKKEWEFMISIFIVKIKEEELSGETLVKWCEDFSDLGSPGDLDKLKIKLLSLDPVACKNLWSTLACINQKEYSKTFTEL